MKARLWCLMSAFLIAGTLASVAQTGDFDLQAYKKFLADHQTLQAAELQVLYPAGSYASSVPGTTTDPLYLNTLREQYSLTDFELTQLRKHGFVVTSRLKHESFVWAFSDIFHRDLPVFVSTDAILQAVHQSYDRILQQVELSTLRPEVIRTLTAIRGQLPALVDRYGGDPRMQQMLRDVDVYVSIPLILLDQAAGPYFTENSAWVNTLLAYIADAQPEKIRLFAETNRIFDFSQFTVRGHYTQDSLLSSYFRAMMWLGRTEIYLLAPEGDTTNWPAEDIQRQVVDAALLHEAVRDAGVLPRIQKIDQILQFMVGESDNVTTEQLQSVLAEAVIGNAAELLDTTRCRAFQDSLAAKPYAVQRILSQILMTDPTDPTQIKPASAFLLLGQRFVIDSYVTGSVVYDKIIHQGIKVRRMLPSTLDVLFALGNNAAGQLLGPEMERYHYAPNAAALRYLVDSYPAEFWSSTMFNGWLQMIRTLNPPEVKSRFPQFMQTAAWWQEKMNTQLASWAQLRHDNLLYAKQSYSGGVVCSYPESYVEPIPEFFAAVNRFAVMAADRFGALEETWIQQYFLRLAATADTLRGIAEKELAGTVLTAEERTFLQSMLVLGQVCGEPISGWYPNLFFTSGDGEKPDYVVADVHTAPTDEFGAFVGWVLHVGTGPVDLAIVAASLPDGQYVAFIGPVLSYCEYLTSNFQRLTDERWAAMHREAPLLRPTFVNLYMANELGESRGEGPSLVTDVPDEPPVAMPASPILFQNFPNPFNASTIIPFAISGGDQHVRLEIYDLLGQLVVRLVDEQLPAGNYTVPWDGITWRDKPAASGIYLCKLQTGNATAARKMVLLK